MGKVGISCQENKVASDTGRNQLIWLLKRVTFKWGEKYQSGERHTWYKWGSSDVPISGREEKRRGGEGKGRRGEEESPLGEIYGKHV